MTSCHVTGHVNRNILKTKKRTNQSTNTTVLLSFINIFLSSQGNIEHFCARKDTLLLNFNVNTGIAFLTGGFNRFYRVVILAWFYRVSELLVMKVTSHKKFFLKNVVERPWRPRFVSQPRFHAEQWCGHKSTFLTPNLCHNLT